MSIPWLGYVYFVISLVPLSVGLVGYRSLARPMKVLTLLCVLSVVSAVAAFILGRLAINNRFIANNYVPVEVLLITAIYFLSTGIGKHRRILVGLATVFTVVWTIDKMLFDIPEQTNSSMALLSRLLLLAMSVYTIVIASQDTDSRLSTKSVFWVASGVIVYSTGTFIVSGLGNRLMQLDLSYFVIAWHINWLLLITTNLLYTKALLCKSQT